jgi:hypothetical protein
VLTAWGIMGATGYARFMVTVAPAGAIALLVGWNTLADRFQPRTAWLRPAVFFAVFAMNAVYVDSWGYSRDARGIADTWQWWRQNERPVTRLIWSHTYASIVANRDPHERQPLSDKHEANVKMLREAGPGTLAIWESEIGPAWHQLTDADFLAAGFQRLRSQQYTLGAILWGDARWWLMAPRTITVHVLYKP